MRNILDIELIATLYYGHLDDPHPLKVMGKVICRLSNLPWNKLVGIPMSEKPLNMTDWLDIMRDVHGVDIQPEEIDPGVWKEWAYG